MSEGGGVQIVQLPGTPAEGRPAERGHETSDLLISPPGSTSTSADLAGGGIKLRAKSPKNKLKMTSMIGQLHREKITAKMLGESLRDRAQRWKAFRGIPFSVLMLVVYQLTMAAMFNIADINEVQRGIRDVLFTTVDTDGNTFADVNDVAGLYTWLDSGFVPLIWDSDSDGCPTGCTRADAINYMPASCLADRGKSCMDDRSCVLCPDGTVIDPNVPAGPGPGERMSMNPVPCTEAEEYVTYSSKATLGGSISPAGFIAAIESALGADAASMTVAVESFEQTVELTLTLADVDKAAFCDTCTDAFTQVYNGTDAAVCGQISADCAVLISPSYAEVAAGRRRLGSDTLQLTLSVTAAEPVRGVIVDLPAAEIVAGINAAGANFPDGLAALADGALVQEVTATTSAVEYSVGYALPTRAALADEGGWGKSFDAEATRASVTAALGPGNAAAVLAALQAQDSSVTSSELDVLAVSKAPRAIYVNANSQNEEYLPPPPPAPGGSDQALAGDASGSDDDASSSDGDASGSGGDVSGSGDASGSGGDASGSGGDASGSGDTPSGSGSQNAATDCEGSWGDWGACSAQCGQGQGTKSRSYTVSTAASGSGAACPADETETCNGGACADVDCEGSWGDWGACSAQCGGGTKSRSYTVSTAASGSGTACPSDETETCNQNVCQGGGGDGGGDGRRRLLGGSSPGGGMMAPGGGAMGPGGGAPQLSRRESSKKATKTYQEFNRVVGGCVIKQHISEKVPCEEHLGQEHKTHAEVVYKSDCHPPGNTGEPCYEGDLELWHEDGHNRSEAGVCNIQPTGESGSSGYGGEIAYLDFADSLCQAKAAIASLQENAWLGATTVDANVEVVLYNGELGLYSVIMLKVVFERGGSVDVTGLVTSAEVPSWTDGKLFLCGLYTLMTLTIVVGEFGELFAGPKAYVKDFWNVLDLAIIGMWVAQVALYLLYSSHLSEAFGILTEDEEKAIPPRWLMIFVLEMAEVIEINHTIRTMGAVLLIMLVLRVIKMCQYHPKLYFITRTIAMASEQLVPFGLVFCIIQYCFAAAAIALFGPNIAGLRDMTSAVLTIFDLLNGEFELTEFSLNPLSSPF
jgi:hypothetical protein